MKFRTRNLETAIPVTHKRIPKLMIISREPPELVEARLGLEALEVIWVTHFLGANVVSPNNLAEIARRINSFMAKNRNGIVILTDFGFLMKNNDHGQIKTFLSLIKDAVSGGNLLVVLKQTSFDCPGFDISDYGFIHLGEVAASQWSVFGSRSAERSIDSRGVIELVSFKPLSQMSSTQHEQ
jgi:hypothetical protein